ncbi:MAG: hypothetical protein JXA20_09570 [Spirochaetes bacterium]|nr:hypothetical protein [Spirochaetota bacterium]
MPGKRLALERGGEKVVELSWKSFWRDFTVRVGSEELGRIEGQRELSEGRDFTLRDGSVLNVRLVRRLLLPELRVLRDGVPLPGSATDPGQRLKIAWGIIYFIGGFNLLLGLIALALRPPLLLQMGIGHGSVAAGCIFLLLGFFVMRRSAVALVLALALVVLDGLWTLYITAAGGGGMPTGGIVMRIFFVIFIYRGFGAIRELRREQGGVGGSPEG